MEHRGAFLFFFLGQEVLKLCLSALLIKSLILGYQKDTIKWIYKERVIISFCRFSRRKFLNF